MAGAIFHSDLGSRQGYLSGEYRVLCVRLGSASRQDRVGGPVRQLGRGIVLGLPENENSSRYSFATGAEAKKAITAC